MKKRHRIFSVVFAAMMNLAVTVTFLMVGDELMLVVTSQPEFTSKCFNWPLSICTSYWDSWTVIFVVIFLCTVAGNALVLVALLEQYPKEKWIPT